MKCEQRHRVWKTVCVVPCLVKVIGGDKRRELTLNKKETKSQAVVVLFQGISALLFRGFLFFYFRNLWLDGTFFREGS